jgi:hypothetical protein
VNCPIKNVLPFIPSLICLAFAVEVNAGTLALQSTPTLNVLVSSFRGLPSWVLEGAEAEASRIFQPARISLKWIDCASGTAPIPCESLQTDGDLVIHFVPRALPLASATALAMTLRSPNHGAAFIFYDRIIALQTSASLLQTMLGRVVAHEITHLLVPEEEHSSSGLMRTHWKPDDLRFTTMGCGTLSARSMQLLQGEARRRTHH